MFENNNKKNFIIEKDPLDSINDFGLDFISSLQ